MNIALSSLTERQNWLTEIKQRVPHLCAIARGNDNKKNSVEMIFFSIIKSIAQGRAI